MKKIAKSKVRSGKYFEAISEEAKEIITLNLLMIKSKYRIKQ